MGNVSVRRSSISGRGLFAKRQFKRGDHIVEYKGRRCLLKDASPNNRYLAKVRGQLTIDGFTSKNLGRWANHSCKPNARLAVTDDDRVFVKAIRRIEPGDEITIHYGREYTERWLPTCKCAACKKE